MVDASQFAKHRQRTVSAFAGVSPLRLGATGAIAARSEFIGALNGWDLRGHAEADTKRPELPRL